MLYVFGATFLHWNFIPCIVLFSISCVSTFHSSFSYVSWNIHTYRKLFLNQLKYFCLSRKSLNAFSCFWVIRVCFSDDYYAYFASFSTIVVFKFCGKVSQHVSKHMNLDHNWAIMLMYFIKYNALCWYYLFLSLKPLPWKGYSETVDL